MAGSVALETHDAAGGNLFFARAIYGGDFIFLRVDIWSGVYYCRADEQTVS